MVADRPMRAPFRLAPPWPVRTWIAIYVVTGVVAGVVSDLAGASQNLMVFRAASLALLRGAPLYGRFSVEFDFYKYSPTFAFAFVPLAVLPWHAAAVLWSAANFALAAWGMVRFVRTVFAHEPHAAQEQRAARFLALAWPGIVLTTDGDQSNLLVAGACLLAIALYLERKSARAAPWLAFSILMKLFPAAFGVFALVGRGRGRAVAWLSACTALLVAAPAVLVGPARLVAYYREWQVLLAGEPAHASRKHWSIMHALSELGLEANSLAVQIPAAMVFLGGAVGYVYCASLASREPTRRLLAVWFTIATLAFVLLFNHRSESPTYVLSGIAAAALLLTTDRPRPWHWLLYVALILAPSPIHSDTEGGTLSALAAKRLFHPLRLVPLTVLWLWATWQLVSPRKRAADAPTL